MEIPLKSTVIYSDVETLACLTVCFNEEPTNLYLDTTNCGPGWIERPVNWPAIYQVGNGTPKLILSNYGPATIKIADK